jgi:hypothetical protein
MNAFRRAVVPFFGNQLFSAIQNRRRIVAVSSETFRRWTSSQEIVMTSSRKAHRIAHCACALLSLFVLLIGGAALASQGPGTGHGTATALTQFTMAVLVYGAAALVIFAGLIGALRRH